MIATRPAAPSEQRVTTVLAAPPLPTNLGPYSNPIAEYESDYQALSQQGKALLDHCADCLVRAAYVPLEDVHGDVDHYCASCARDLVRRELGTVVT